MDIDISDTGERPVENQWMARLKKLWEKLRRRWREALLTAGKYVLAVAAIGIYIAIFTTCHHKSMKNRYIIRYKPAKYSAEAYFGFSSNVCLEQEKLSVLEIKCSSHLETNSSSTHIGSSHFDIDFRPVQALRRFLASLVGVPVAAFLLFFAGLIADLARKTQRHSRNRLIILYILSIVLYVVALVVQIVSWIVLDIAQRAVVAVPTEHGVFTRGRRAFELQGALFGVLFLIVIAEGALFFEREWPSG